MHVSITGVAGSGKSTLAAAVAARLADDHGWRVAWVDVESEPLGTSLSKTLQRSLDVDDLEPSTLRLTTYGRSLLVLLDGSDARLHEIAEATASLERCASIRVALTSIRGVTGPNVVSVPIGGLEVPPLDASGPELAKYPAVELFLLAASAARPGLEVDESMLSEIAAVCRALDGLPLAVKLAAGRLARPQNSAARVARYVQADPTFGLMLSAVGPGSQPQGHQGSVRASLDWTYSLLSPTQQRVLRRMSVFSEPFGLDAAEHVCEITKYELLESREDLAGLGLLEICSDEEEFRFETHSLVRAFGADALVEMGEVARCSGRHAEWFSQVARRASQEWDECRLEADGGLRAVEADVYVALDYLVEVGRTAEALRVAADLGHLAVAAGNDRDLLTRLITLLAEIPTDAKRADLADALLWAAALELQVMTAPDTVDMFRRTWSEGMALARAEGEPLRVLRGLVSGVLALPVTGNFSDAKAAAEEGLGLAREVGNAAWLARFTAWSGMIAHQERDFAKAARLASDGLGIALRSSDRRALTLVGMLVSGMPPEHAPALPLMPPMEELYVAAVELGDRDLQSWLLEQLAARASRGGDPRSAASWILRRVELVRGSRAWHALGFSLLGSVPVVAQLGHLKLAARVHGSLAAMMPVLMAALGARDESAYSATVLRLEAALGTDVFDDQVRAGSQLTWTDALLETLPVLDEAACGLRPARPQLSARESEVLLFLSDGLSNKDIASRLGLSPKTVMHYSTSVYRKLGVRGRSEAAATAVRMGLGTT